MTNIRNYAEKGLVQDLRSTAEKIAIITDRAMAEDEMPDETVMIFDRLVARAVSTLSTIHEFRDHGPGPHSDTSGPSRRAHRC